MQPKSKASKLIIKYNKINSKCTVVRKTIPRKSVTNNSYVCKQCKRSNEHIIPVFSHAIFYTVCFIMAFRVSHALFSFCK